MKHYFTLIFCFFSFFTIAQSKDTAILEVKYKFSYVYDTTKPDQPVLETMRLFVGRNCSKYESYDYFYEDSLQSASLGEKIAPDGRRVIGYKYFSNTIRFKNPNTLYVFRNPSKSLNKFRFMKEVEFLYEPNMANISWEITTEKNIIKGIACQKAKGWCKGRLYEAWFAPGIPFSAGPLKLSGLPGLIIEATDSLKQVSFQLESIADISQRKYIIEIPNKAIKTTSDKFKLILDAFNENPFILMKFYQFPNSNVNTDEIADQFFKDNAELMNKIKMDNSRKPKIVNNNPIELPEKQSIY